MRLLAKLALVALVDAVLPLIVMVFVFQRFFIKGIAVGAVKG